MRNSPFRFVGLAAFAALVAFLLIAGAGRPTKATERAAVYSIVPLPTPSWVDSVDAYITAINDKGAMSFSAYAQDEAQLCGIVTERTILTEWAASVCEMNAINNAGYAVGAYLFQPPPEYSSAVWMTLSQQGFEGAGERFQSFISVNARGQAAVIEDSPYYQGAGIYDLYAGQLVSLFSDPTTGCTDYWPYFITERGDVFAQAKCPNQPPLVVISGFHYHYLTPPGDLTFSRANNNNLIALTSASSGHVYLWPSPWKATPIDIGHPAKSDGSAEPTGLNDRDVMVGTNGDDRGWIWDAAHGFRDLSRLLPKNTYIRIIPLAVNNRNDIGANGVGADYSNTMLLLKALR